MVWRYDRPKTPLECLILRFPYILLIIGEGYLAVLESSDFIVVYFGTIGDAHRGKD
jgi:hypothetical protein